MGRPTVCTPELTERAAETIRRGGAWKDVVAATGIGERTLYRWQADGEGEDADPLYQQFRQAIEKARSEARLNMLGVIAEAAHKGRWQAAAWWLERKYPEEFALVNRLRDETPAENRPPVVAIEADTVRRVLAQYDELDERRRAKTSGNGQAEAM